MNIYKTEDIRNVVLLGHGSCGKTTLTEAIALLGGLVSRMGTVTGGNTISDFDKEEQKRGFSISTSVIPIEYTDKENGQVNTALSPRPAAVSEHRSFANCSKMMSVRAGSKSNT